MFQIESKSYNIYPDFAVNETILVLVPPALVICNVVSDVKYEFETLFAFPCATKPPTVLLLLSTCISTFPIAYAFVIEPLCKLPTKPATIFLPLTFPKANTFLAVPSNLPTNPPTSVPPINGFVSTFPVA